MNQSLHVLFEDNHCLAVVKPARVLTAGDRTGDDSLLDRAKAYLKEKYAKPGNVFLGVVHRLDRPVSGVVLFARTSKGAARLSEQFREGSIRKTYQALVEGVVNAEQGELQDWLIKNEETNVVRAVARDTPGAKESRLRYRRLKTGNGLTLLEIVPLTGRSHQIRVQLAQAGHPISGDGKYGSSRTFEGSIALHAAELTFAHPVTREAITISAPTPARWPTLLGK